MAKIEMEGSSVFVGFDGLIFIAVLTTPETLESGRESMEAAIDFSIFVHFSIKIIKRN